MAVKESMNITRALAELKRIQKNIEEFVAVRGKYISIAVGRGDKKKIPGQSVAVEKVEELINANIQKIDSLFSRRSAIKRAIVLSNATKKINFGGKEITVAEAIELRTHVAPMRAYLNDMVNEYATAIKSVDDANAKLTTRIESQVLEATKNLSNAPDMEETLTSIRKSVTETHLDLGEASLINPAKLEERIAKERDRIDSIETELDYLLNESNATTTVDFEY